MSPVRMSRIAIVAPTARLRGVLARVADAGVVEIEHRGPAPVAPALHGKEEGSDTSPRISLDPPDIDALRARGQWDLLAGEAELQQREADSIEHGPASILVGWAPEAQVGLLGNELAETGTSIVELPRPSFVQPPTYLTGSRASRAFRPLIDTYGVIPYEDIDPTLFAGVTYAVMFGMMFGDVGHGLILTLLGFLLWRTSSERLSRFRRFWVFTVAAGAMAMVFGFLYGEFFGPTGVIPVIWISPLDDPMTLLMAGVAVGALFLAASYIIGIVNRWREGGPGLALYAASGIAGSLLFFGAAVSAGGLVWAIPAMTYTGAAVAGIGLVLMFIGFVVEGGGGGAGVAQAVVELFDTVIRLAANLVSFGRLAAFGLAHAAITSLVWDGTTALWGPGLAAVGAVVVFVVGNAVAFALEALVVGVQALRLEYYELFSRILTGEGRMFHPWHVPIAEMEET